MSEFIGVEASVLIVPDTTKFRAELLAQVKAATAGVATTAPALTGAAVATSNLGAIQAKGANDAKKLTAEMKKQAAQARDTAKAHEQLGRGAGSSLLTLLGIRGATLAASGSFLAGAAAIGILRKSVSGAIDDEETLFRVTRILGTELGDESKKWSTTLASSFGIADDAALKFEGAIAETLHNVGIAPEANFKLSKSFVELAADMAAFAHVPVEDTLRALQLAISGNARSLRQYGVVIQNSEVQERALTDTGKKHTDQLTRQELALARISIIQDRTSNQVGAFAANQGSLANQTKILAANLDQLGDALGSAIIPTLTDAVKLFNDFADPVRKTIDAAKDLGIQEDEAGKHHSTWDRIVDHSVDTFNEFAHVLLMTGPQAVKGFAGATRDLTDAFHLTEAAVPPLTTDLFELFQMSDLTATGIRQSQLQALEWGRIGPAAAAGIAALTAALHGLVVASNISGGVREQALNVEIGGGSLQAQLGAANAVVAQQEKVVAAATAAAKIQAGSARSRRDRVEARRAAKQQLADDQRAAKGIQDQINANAEAAANAAEAAARKAQREAEQARQEHDQAILTRQQFDQADLEIKATRAQRTKSLVDDLAVQKEQLALLNRQIVDAHNILDATLRRQTIQSLTLQAEQAFLNIQASREKQLQNIRDRKVTAAENAVESARLDAELADTLKKPKAQLAALQRENKALEEERKLWQGNVLKLKEIRNQIAANNAEIKKIRGETDNRADELARLEFTFLQTQSGFAGTLLSNLIPHDVAAGTVGGAAINTSTGAFDSIGPAGFATAAHRRPGQDLSDATQTKASARGASMSQMATLITINRHMLQAILRLTNQRAHPEATYQTYTGATEFNVATGT